MSPCALHAFSRSTPGPYWNRNPFPPVAPPLLTQPALPGARSRILGPALPALNPDTAAHGEIAVHAGPDRA